jgi:integrase
MAIRKREWVASGKTKSAWIYEYRDHDGKQHIKTFATQGEAKAYRDEFGFDLKKAKPSDLTLNDASEIWLKAVTHGRKDSGPAEYSTLRSYRSHLKHHILPVMANKKLATLGKADVAAFRDHLLEKLSRAMAKKVLTSFKGILSEAEARGLINANIAASATIGNKGRHKEPVAIPSKDEIRRLLTKLDELATNRRWRRWRALFLVAIYSGFRSSEIRGLPWEAVDLKAGTLTVMQRADERGVIGPPKSQSSRRTIIIPEFLVTILRNWKVECGPSRLVFPNSVGNVQSNADIHQRGWHPLQRAAGVLTAEGKPKLNFHCLRHFRASLLIDDGANAKEVQREMGHANIQMTFDVYGHLFSDTDADARRKERAERLAVF